jgi:hypothetical protein
MSNKKRTDTTVAINGDRNIRLQKAAVDVTIANKEICKMSSIIQHLIDNYLDEAVKDLKNQLKE